VYVEPCVQKLLAATADQAAKHLLDPTESTVLLGQPAADPLLELLLDI